MEISEQNIKKIKEIANYLTEGDAATIEVLITTLKNIAGRKESTFGGFIFQNVVNKSFKGGRRPILTLDEMVELFDTKKSKTAWQDLHILLMTAVYDELHRKDIKIHLAEEKIEDQEQN